MKKDKTLECITDKYGNKFYEQRGEVHNAQCMGYKNEFDGYHEHNHLECDSS